MDKRGITRTDVNAALTNALERMTTKGNRVALYSLINNRYLLLILEKVNNEEIVITAMWSDKKRLRRIGFTKI